jgi:hypothetical protein
LGFHFLLENEGVVITCQGDVAEAEDVAVERVWSHIVWVVGIDRSIFWQVHPAVRSDDVQVDVFRLQVCHGIPIRSDCLDGSGCPDYLVWLQKGFRYQGRTCRRAQQAASEL